MHKIFMKFVKSMSVFTLCLTMAVSMPACGDGNGNDEPENPFLEDVEDNEDNDNNDNNGSNEENGNNGNNGNNGGSTGDNLTIAKLAGIWAEADTYQYYSAAFDTYEKQNASKDVYYNNSYFVSGFEINSDGTSTDYCWETRAFEQQPVLRVIKASDGTVYWSRIDKSRGDYFYVKNGKLFSEERGECRVVDNKVIVIGTKGYVKVR